MQTKSKCLSVGLQKLLIKLQKKLLKLLSMKNLESRLLPPQLERNFIYISH
jgi:hypothetical protein